MHTRVELQFSWFLLKGGHRSKFSIHKPKAWGKSPCFFPVRKKGKIWLVSENKFFFIEKFQPIACRKNDRSRAPPFCELMISRQLKKNQFQQKSLDEKSYWEFHKGWIRVTTSNSTKRTNQMSH